MPTSGLEGVTMMKRSPVLARVLVVALGLGLGLGLAHPLNLSAAPLPATKGQPSAPWRDCEAVHCPWLVSLPAGSFVMGSPQTEPLHMADEGPQRTVRVASFAIGQHEVTFDQWDACVAAGGCPEQPRDSQATKRPARSASM
jgi:formylglycine-generating enzyme required for sulfatase activity